MCSMECMGGVLGVEEQGQDLIHVIDVRRLML